MNGESLKIHSQSCRHNYCRFWAMLPLDNECFAWPGLRPLGGSPSWVELVSNLLLPRHPFIGKQCPNLRHSIFRRPLLRLLSKSPMLKSWPAKRDKHVPAPLLASGQITITSVGNPIMAIFFALPVAMGNRNSYSKVYQLIKMPTRECVCAGPPTSAMAERSFICQKPTALPSGGGVLVVAGSVSVVRRW